MENNELLKNGEEIYKIDTIADGLRNTGYRSIYNAIAEIVDNSIESNAKNSIIIGKEDLIMSRQRIISFAFLDDGDGMDDEILSKCLQIGFSSRRERKGMGRFGVGLPQASFYASSRVEVYSWKEGYSNCKCVYIDLNLVTNGSQKRIVGPYSCEVPTDYQRFLNLNINGKTYDFTKHGTLVVWPKVDKEDPRKWNTFKRNISFDLGRKYRWMLNDKSIEISTVKFNDLETFQKITPNDPLFLMNYGMHCVKKGCNDHNDKCEPYDKELGFTETMFEPFTSKYNQTGIVNHEVKYYDKNGEIKTSSVKISFSLVKENLYDKRYVTKDPGSLSYGKIAKQNMGISIVRQNREIDFGEFGFFSSLNEPTHRWWGCEIALSSDLDEAFGISNNKQQVDLKPIDEESYGDYDEVKPMWLQLYDIISNNIKEMVSINKQRRTGTRNITTGTTLESPLGENVKEAEKANPEIAVDTTTEPEKITQEIIEDIKKELVKEGAINETDTITEEQAQQYLDSNIRTQYVNYGVRNSFIDYEEKLGVLIIKINKDHPFYTQFVINAYSNAEMVLTFELFLASFIKTVYELRTTDRNAMEKLIEKLNSRLKLFMR